MKTIKDLTQNIEVMRLVGTGRAPSLQGKNPPFKGAGGCLDCGLKAQQSLAWGNALRYNKEIAEQVRNDGRYKNTFFNHYVQKSQKILIFLNILMISHLKNNLL